MPAQPLTPAQKADADRLAVLFRAWQQRQKDSRLPFSQEAAAATLGFGQSALSQYLQGRIPLNVQALVKFARMLGCAPGDISATLAGDIENLAGSSKAAGREIVDLETVPGLIQIRKVIFKISAGIAGFSVDFPDNGEGSPLFLPASWAESKGLRPENLYATRVAGDSMSPRILDRDVVVVNTADTRRERDAIFAANHEGEFTVKRLQYMHRRWWLCSDNPDQKAYQPIECSDGTYLMGRIVHLDRDL